jgi:hypothetical protein
MAASTLFKLGGEIYKATSPYIKKFLTQKGAKPVNKVTADRINKNPSTITNVNQIKSKGRSTLRPSTKVVKPKSGVTSQQRSALSDMGGQTVKLSKPSPSMKPKPRVVKPSVAASKPSASAAKPRTKITTQPPKKSTKPMTRGRAARIGGATTAITLGALFGNKGQKKSGAVTGPKPRPKTKEGGPGRKFAKPSEGVDPRGNQIKATPGKMIMPKKFDGGYNSKTQKLVSITVDGKKSTYEIPKGMTTKQAKSLLTGTVKKKKGGNPTLEKMPMPKTKPKSKKTPPSKYKGFSKLPESVQKRISPNLASKYKGGGSIKSGAARQVKGFGAARRPKK